MFCADLTHLVMCVIEPNPATRIAAALLYIVEFEWVCPSIHRVHSLSIVHARMFAVRYSESGEIEKERPVHVSRCIGNSSTEMGYTWALGWVNPAYWLPLDTGYRFTAHLCCALS